MMARLWALVQPGARKHFLGLLLLVSVGGLVELAGISTTAELMGLVASQGRTGPGGPLTYALDYMKVEEAQERLQFGLVWAVSVLFLVHGYAIVRTYTKSKFSWIQEKEISTRLFQACLGRPYSWFLQKNSGELHRLIGSGHFIKSILQSVLSAIGNFAVALTLVVALIFADPLVSLAGLMVVAGAYFLVRLFTKKALREKGALAHSADRSRRITAQEALTSIRFVKTTGAEASFVKEYGEHTGRAAQGMVYHAIYVDTVRAFLEWVTFTCILSLSVYLASESDNLEVILPQLTLYTMAGYRLIPAVHTLFGLWSRLKFDTSYLHEVEDLLQPLIDQQEAEQKPLEGLEQAEELVSLEDVTYQYEGSERQAVKNVDLILKRGQWLGVVGTTGAGKTTLLDLISGLCAPKSGAVRAGKTALGPEYAQAWQNQLGVVPQEVILLDDTVARNVAFGVSQESIDHELVTEVCHLAGLKKLLSVLPDGLETRLGERGTRLSGGERQRVGLARALYRKPSLLLLDEATSALDQATEARIIETLKELSENCTLVTVAHRLSSVQPCDNIVVMEEGEIISSGTFDELLSNSETFRRLALHSG